MKGDPLRIVGPFCESTGYSHMARYMLHTAIVAGYDVEAVEAAFFNPITVFGDGRRVDEPRRYREAEPGKIWPPQDEERTRCMFPSRVVVEELPKDSNGLPIGKPARYRVANGPHRLPPNTPTFCMVIPPNLHHWGQEFGGGPVIGYTMTESDDIIDYWKHNMRCVDMLVSPSTYCLDTYRRAIPEVPSDLLPIPIDTRLYTPDDFKAEVGYDLPPFLFFSAFTTGERKNWRMLMQAFAEEFQYEGESVGLIVKPSEVGEVERMAGWLREMGASVYVVSRQMNDWEFAGLYRLANVYVQPSSEGFGLGPAEAGLCGRPSVALSLSGSIDVVNEGNGYLVPSTMQPIIGHMPQWYPRTHKLASCDIDDLRRTLRRAYEQEEAGINKGAVARRQMLERFSPEVVAPELRRVVDRAIAIHAETRLYSIAPPSPTHATAAGNWGDVFACVGNIQRVMRERGIDKIGVILIAKDPGIADWLTEQPWCTEVVYLGVKDKKSLDVVFGRVSQCKPVHGQAEIRRLVKKGGFDVDPQRIAFTHLTMTEPQEPEYWSGARLSPSARLWAHEVCADIPGEFLLVNPLSVASNNRRQHWAGWNDAVAWLLNVATVPVVLVGEQKIDWPGHPNLINLSGESKSMQDVLALAEESAGIISTSNNLGIYAPIANIPSVIVCARTCDPGHLDTCKTFYYKWMEREPITLVRWGSNLEMFQEAVRRRFGRLLREYVVEPVPDLDAEFEAAMREDVEVVVKDEAVREAATV